MVLSSSTFHSSNNSVCWPLLPTRIAHRILVRRSITQETTGTLEYYYSVWGALATRGCRRLASWLSFRCRLASWLSLSFENQRHCFFEYRVPVKDALNSYYYIYVHLGQRILHSACRSCRAHRWIDRTKTFLTVQIVTPIPFFPFLLNEIQHHILCPNILIVVVHPGPADFIKYR